jgi:hypothetical protein
MTTALEGVKGQRHAPAAFYPEKDPVSIVQEAGWAPEPVWTGAENLAPTGIRSPDRPARCQSLYRLRYPANYTPGNGEIKVRLCPFFNLGAKWERGGGQSRYPLPPYGTVQLIICTVFCRYPASSLC